MLLAGLRAHRAQRSRVRHRPLQRDEDLLHAAEHRAGIRAADRRALPRAELGHGRARAAVRGARELVSDLPCNVRREGGKSLVIGGPSLVILEGNACNPL